MEGPAIRGIDPEVLADRLHMARRKHRPRLSLDDLELLSGVPASAISRYENMQATPDVDRVAALAIALGLTLDYLVGLTDDPELPDPDSPTRVWSNPLIAA